MPTAPRRQGTCFKCTCTLFLVGFCTINYGENALLANTGKAFTIDSTFGMSKVSNNFNTTKIYGA
jgi:hypothetical protein